VIGDWRKHRLLESEQYDWLLFGNVLNEISPNSPEAQMRFDRGMKLWMQKSGVGGALFIEPAFRTSGQLLSQIRDQLLEGEKKPQIISPCLHSGRCPFASGRDWCHFSVLAKVPGKWFIYLSKGLSAEREWLKYSHLWLTFDDRTPVKKPLPNERLVLTDSLIKNPKAPQLYLLCEPEKAGRLQLSPSQPKLHRGEHYLMRSGAERAAITTAPRREQNDEDFRERPKSERPQRRNDDRRMKIKKRPGR